MAATTTCSSPRPPARVLAAAAAVAAASAATWVAAVGATPGPATSPPASPAPEADVYLPPVDAPVADPFRPPTGPYGPGNRGIEYDTAPGQPVGAIGPGEVVFAGPVARALHVTVRHPDGLRSSYSLLADLSVVRGQLVGRGDQVGTAGESLHLGVRTPDGTYLDPALLFGSYALVPRLLPHAAPADEDPPAGAPGASGGPGVPG
jgi:murein DD-endopeptidase MepM/ murein hydrolase activator NlpD